VHSAMPIKLAKRLCPDAIIIRGDYDAYSKHSDMVTQIICEDVPLFERSSIDEFYIDLTGMDKFFGSYKHATELRQRIIKETGLPISFGMSANKTVSKIATDEAKPNNQMKVDFGEEKIFLAPLSVKKIPMVGEKTYILLRGMGIEKVKTVQEMPMELMENVLGENGISIWKKANGIDNNPVEPYSEQKSMSQEETFDQDTIDVEKLKNILIAMSEKLCFRLRAEKKVTSCVSVKIRYSNFDTHTMQCRIPYTSCDHTIIARIKELFEKLYNRRLLIRLVGVKFTHLVGGMHQINLFEDSEEIINLYQAMDRMRFRFGEDKIHRAAALSFSLRGFNPFNGINSSPVALEKNDEEENSIIPSIKSLNKLITLPKNIAQTKNSVEGISASVYEYLLVVSPPLSVKNEVMEIKNRFHTAHKHIQAIKSKPHITLINFMMSDAEEETLLYKIEQVAKSHEAFDVLLTNFNHFKTHTIYIDIGHKEPIVNLVRSLHATLNLPSGQSFFAWKPHMTIAKGLTEEKFYKAMAELQQTEFTESFIAENILLMKHAEKFSKYEIVREFSLGN
jgi:DNA polymerase-4